MLSCSIINVMVPPHWTGIRNVVRSSPKSFNEKRTRTRLLEYGRFTIRILYECTFSVGNYNSIQIIYNDKCLPSPLRPTYKNSKTKKTRKRYWPHFDKFEHQIMILLFPN